MTGSYLSHNFYNILAFQSVCIYFAYLGSDFFRIMSLLHIMVHIPFIVISILTYVFIIKKNFYKEHPCLF